MHKETEDDSPTPEYFNPEAVEFPPGTRVLVAEDDPTTRMMLVLTLTEWGVVPIEVENGREALDVLTSPDPPKLALLDWMMPELNGIDVCRILRAKGEEPYIYIILLTAMSRLEDLLVGLQSGADDYLSKPFEPAELRVRLKSGERIVQLQAQLLAARERLKWEATYDHLTGLLNRRAISRELTAQLARASRGERPLTVAIADIDFFKSINDTHGHDAGDAALREVASRLKSGLRQYDSVGRLGGEEFLLIFPESDIAAGVAAADRLRELVNSVPIELTPEVKKTISLSFGCVASFSSTPDEMVTFADRALYQSKENGRNRVEVYELEC